MTVRLAAPTDAEDRMPIRHRLELLKRHVAHPADVIAEHRHEEAIPADLGHGQTVRRLPG